MRLLLWLPGVTLALLAADWPRFRGPNGAGVASGSGLPAEFGPDKNVVWKAGLPLGKSSPALTEKHIFLTGWEGDRLITLCLDQANGKILWRRSVTAERREHLHDLNDRASSSPVTDGKNVYVFF